MVCLFVVLGLDLPNCGVGGYGVVGDVNFECFCFVSTFFNFEFREREGERKRESEKRKQTSYLYSSCRFLDLFPVLVVRVV